jgi:hypothetical protein
MLEILIELYMGRPVDFGTEVILDDLGEGPFIKEWNIEEKPIPRGRDFAAHREEAERIFKDREEKKALTPYIKPAAMLTFNLNKGNHDKP